MSTTYGSTSSANPQFVPPDRPEAADRDRYLKGDWLFANLPAASVLPGGTLAYTTDQGMQVVEAGSWTAIGGGGGGSGTVTSVGLTSTSNTLSVTGTSPITTSGSLDLEVLSVPASALPALTGDATTSAGSAVVTVGKLNGTSLAGLATGILKNTTTTGVPSIAAAGTDYVAPGTATTFAAVQTFPTSDLVIKGTSTGTTAVASANAGASNFTLTLPAATDTVVTLAATQTLTNKSISGSQVNSGLVVGANGGTGVANTGFTLTYGQNSTFTSSTGNIGTLEILQNSQSAAYGLVLTDSGKQIYHSSASAHTFTIPANSSVAFPIGSTVTFINETGGGVVTIAITTDTLIWSPAGTTGSRSLAANGICTAVKVTSTSWIISGSGLT